MTFKFNKNSSKIGILMGGIGPERDISLKSGQAIEEGLQKAGFQTSPVLVNHETPSSLKAEKLDAAVIALHGPYGEDGCIQGVLEFLKIPYTGSGVLASALSMDKHISKTFFRSKHIPTAKHICISKPEISDLKNLIQQLEYPVFIKPRFGGSSVASGKANDLESMIQLCEQVFRVDEFAIIEQFMEGREVAVAILNDKVLGSIEISPKGDFYDFRSKYEKGQSEYFIPARLDTEILKQTNDYAISAHQTIGASGATRVDFLVTAENKPIILEINTIPGFTPTSLVPKIAKAQKIDFPELCELLVESASLKQSTIS